MSQDDAHPQSVAKHPEFGSPLPPPSGAASTPPNASGAPPFPRLPPSGRPTAPPALTDTVQRLLDDDGSALALFSLDGAVHDLSRAMLRLLGVESIDEIRSGSPADGVLRSFLDHVPTELFNGRDGVWHGRVDHRTLAGDRLILRATATAIAADPSGPVVARNQGGRLALLLHDVTIPQRRMAALVHRATHDPLTGLANRHQLLRALATAIATQRGRPGHVAAIFIDLDHLKYVNDAFGHGAGDHLLVASSQRLALAVRPGDEIARIGGDEFLVVAGGVADATTALDLAERARRALTGHLRIGELDLEFTVSVGVALTDSDVLGRIDEDAASVLISNADTAMYESKQNGRGRCSLFTAHMRSEARQRTEMAAALSHAISAGSIGVEYQPIFSTVSRAPVAAEALVRWVHPTTGNVDTATLIAVAEESGTIGRLGELVLERSMRDLGEWMSSGVTGDGFAVHVNVSRIQLASSTFVSLVLDRLARYRLEPGQLVLEARESPLLSHEAGVVRTIRALRRAGVQVAVDNFGTGSRALAVLTDVGADVLKLDGSLALPSGSSESDIRLVRALVLLAHALQMDVVAERVSGYEQLRRLQAAGCDMVQGNLLGPPAPADELDTTVRETW
jgi:diguanylate cyclase (GGDEF)-like protein